MEEDTFDTWLEDLEVELGKFNGNDPGDEGGDELV